MANYKMVVLSRPTPGREDEYHEWYQNVHLAQVVAIKGFKGAQRFRLSTNMMEGEAWPYLAIYDMETDDLDALLADVQSKAGGEFLLLSEAIDTASAYASIYQEFGEKVEAKA